MIFIWAIIPPTLIWDAYKSYLHTLSLEEVSYSTYGITLCTVSRHTVVCRAAQEAGAPHREYIDRKNENVILTPLYLGDHLSDWNQICYTVARQPRESTFQIWRKSLQPFPRYELPKFRFFSSFFSSSSSSFRTLAKIAITSKRVLRSPCNLAHRKGVQMRILASNLVQIRWMVQELWPIIRVKQDRFVVTPTG